MSSLNILSLPRRATIVICLMATVVLFASTSLASKLDGLWFDSRTALLRSFLPLTVNNDVRLVGIDDQTLNEWDEPLVLWHNRLAALFDAIAIAKPKLVVLDLALPSKSFDKFLPNADKNLTRSLASLRGAAPVILGITADREGNFISPMPDYLAAAGLQSNGYVLWKSDADGVVRKFTEQLGAHGENVPTLTGGALRAIGLVPVEGFVDYTRGDAFGYVPMQKITSLNAKDRTGWIDELSGKIIIVGSALAFDDSVPQAANLAAWQTPSEPAGMILHAQAIRSHLAGTMITQLPRGLAFLIAFACCSTFFLHRKLAVALAIQCASLLILFCVGLYSLRAGWDLAWSLVWAATLITLAATLGAALRANILERLRVHGLFAGYVSKPILDCILSGALENDLSKKRRALCFMFADIRGFTAYSKTVTPEHTIQLLNRYLSRMTAVIHRHGGTVDKYRGDGIMAFFGAPLASHNSARDGLLAGIEMLKELESFNDELERENEPRIKIGVGLAYGEAVIGNIGSKDRHDFTAIGDAVNLAAHIQEHSKTIHFDLLCTELTFAIASKGASQDLPLTNAGVHNLPKHGKLTLYGYKNGNDKNA